MGVEAYCMKCKTKRMMLGPKEVKGANGRIRMEGKCPTCGIKMCVFVKSTPKLVLKK